MSSIIEKLKRYTINVHVGNLQEDFRGHIVLVSDIIEVESMMANCGNDLVELRDRVADLESALETERMRLAACGVAALGYFDGCVEEYKSSSLDDVLRLRDSAAFYKRRCDELQRWQSAMRDPERTLVCDVLANGCTLPPSHANGRYGSMTSSANVAEQPGDGIGHFSIPHDLHPDTATLVSRFATALAAKLERAQRKYGYSDGWKSNDWMDECRAKLMEHIEKGDPRDVANYCMFLWHHGERTALPAVAELAPLKVPDDETLARIHKSAWQQSRNLLHFMQLFAEGVLASGCSSVVTEKPVP